MHAQPECAGLAHGWVCTRHASECAHLPRVRMGSGVKCIISYILSGTLRHAGGGAARTRAVIIATANLQAHCVIEATCVYTARPSNADPAPVGAARLTTSPLLERGFEFCGRHWVVHLGAGGAGTHTHTHTHGAQTRERPVPWQAEGMVTACGRARACPPAATPGTPPVLLPPATTWPWVPCLAV